MPTTITAQSGTQIKQSTKITASGCAKTRARPRVRILAHRIVGHTLILKVSAPAAGRLSAGGKDLRTLVHRFRKAAKATLKVKLSHRGLRALHKHHRLRIVVRVRFVPSHRGASSTSASAAATFRR